MSFAAKSANGVGEAAADTPLAQQLVSLLLDSVSLLSGVILEYGGNELIDRRHALQSVLEKLVAVDDIALGRSADADLVTLGAAVSLHALAALWVTLQLADTIANRVA